MDPEPPSLLLLTLNVDVSVISGLVLLLILLCCSALISGAEVAFFSLTKSDLDAGLVENTKTFDIISKLLDRPKKIISYHTSSK